MRKIIRARLTPISLFTCAMLLAAGSAVGALADDKHATVQKTSQHQVKPHAGAPKATPKRTVTERRTASRQQAKRRVPTPRPRPNTSSAIGATDAIRRLILSDSNMEVLKEAIRLARSGKAEEAVERCTRIQDDAGRKVVEWVILRSGAAMSFARYAAFVRANPSWPSVDLFQRRAEARLWLEQHEPGTVLSFFANREPLGALGKLSMARAAMARGDRDAARKHFRSAWRGDHLSAGLESQVLKMSGPLLSRADHKARMHARLYADDLSGAMRAARRLGAADVAIVKARIAVNGKARNAGAMLDAVPKAARNDPAYLFTHAQWLRREGRIEAAARVMLSAPSDPLVIRDADSWWIERRILVRELLDEGKPQIAYRIAHGAALPSKESLRVDQPFTAGWVALRFLHDPHTAKPHFARIPRITTHPTSLARAGYWLGRVADQIGNSEEARRHYAAAAQHSAAYYGQLARARLGGRKVPVRRLPAIDRAQREALRNVDLLRAVELLYATGHPDLVVSFVADLDRADDVNVLALIAEAAARRRDARAMLVIGKRALARGLALDQYAFPSFGLPEYVTLGPKADTSLVYAIARAESAFTTNAVSSAKAMGLMQVTPAAGRTIARRLGIKFDRKRLLNDSAFNLQLGAAEIADLVDTYGGNHVLAFVGYNAGRGRVKEWISRYGDPRDPSVDAVDWVERIPFTETRIYVQRVMENLQVYRSRFGERAQLAIEADMRGEMD